MVLSGEDVVLSEEDVVLLGDVVLSSYWVISRIGGHGPVWESWSGWGEMVSGPPFCCFVVDFGVSWCVCVLVEAKARDHRSLSMTGTQSSDLYYDDDISLKERLARAEAVSLCY